MTEPPAPCAFVHKRTGAHCPYAAVVGGYCRPHWDTQRSPRRPPDRPPPSTLQQPLPAGLCRRCPRGAVEDGLCRSHYNDHFQPRVRHLVRPVVAEPDLSTLPRCTEVNRRTGESCPQPAWPRSDAGRCQAHEVRARDRERKRRWLAARRASETGG